MTGQPDWGQLNARFIEAFRANGGRVGGLFEGNSVLLLHTVGARTGAAYTVPLTYLWDAGRFVVFASNVGAERNPGWYYNVLVNPDVTLEVGVETFPARASLVKGAERDLLWARQIARVPRFGAYEGKTTRVIPAVALTRQA
ncbi:nitroreductase family deazaflavin-dependent oxidoreductase [Actinoplanes sp. NPDC049596]|uniref:nitroreductase family deazaflavin-dependent oxidoreductase n=1 Tax=unclassified Actinoplanes TaxID=2626549 RepID=UPI00341401FB